MGSEGDRKVTKTMFNCTLRVIRRKLVIFTAIVIIALVCFHLICILLLIQVQAYHAKFLLSRLSNNLDSVIID